MRNCNLWVNLVQSNMFFSVALLGICRFKNLLVFDMMHSCSIECPIISLEHVSFSNEYDKIGLNDCSVLKSHYVVKCSTFRGCLALCLVFDKVLWGQLGNFLFQSGYICLQIRNET